MNANDIAFGIEFETTLPASDTTSIGPYHNGTQVPWLPTGWKAERDSSIKTLAPNRKGCEFVSPVLHGVAGVQQVEAALDAINARGARVNFSTGLHITVTFDGDAAALARLISLVSNHEKAIFCEHGDATPRAGGIFEEDQALWQQGRRQATLRSGSLPPSELDTLGPRTEPHRIPSIRRHDQQNQSHWLPDDGVGFGRTRVEHPTLQRLGLREEAWDKKLLGSTWGG